MLTDGIGQVSAERCPLRDFERGMWIQSEDQEVYVFDESIPLQCRGCIQAAIDDVTIDKVSIEKELDEEDIKRINDQIPDPDDPKYQTRYVGIYFNEETGERWGTLNYGLVGDFGAIICTPIVYRLKVPCLIETTAAERFA